MFLIDGSVKDYAWGITDGLAPWTHQVTGGPQAELWFGSHPSGPSPIAGSDSTLADHLTHDEAPILAKVLAAGQPLSVQVHPDAEQARHMWANQQVAGPQILSDPYEKAEVLLALEPFDAFVGWRPTADAAEIIERLPGMALAASALHSGDRTTAIQMIVERSDQAEALAPQVVEALLAAAQAGRLTRPVDDREVAAYRSAARDFPQDIGVVLTALLDFATLQPGQAVYLAPGIPHSYVRGIGFEVMTTSDNVLRLGLTSKPVHVDHALKILDFMTPAQFLDGSVINPVGASFGLRRISGDSTPLAEGGYRIVVAIDGSAQITCGSETMTAVQGQAVVITAGENVATVTTEGLAVAASAPPMEP